jgi:small subunit ribosomal protein S4
MSRYLGPRLKVMRSLGVELPGLSRKSTESRPYPPGQHGQRRRGKESDYARQLKEKQKLRFNYGVSERQLRRVVLDARRSKTATGEKLLELLESRLDNVVFRAGFARTIPAARQLVNHGHLRVNGKRVDIASYRVKQGDVLTLRDKSKNLGIVAESLESPSLQRPEWLQIAVNDRKATVTSTPGAESVPFPVDILLVVEYYSKRI